MNRWQEIWEKRSLVSSDGIRLSDPISVDGFDTGFGTISEEDWTDYIEHKEESITLSIKKNRLDGEKVI